MISADLKLARQVEDSLVGQHHILLTGGQYHADEGPPAYAPTLCGIWAESFRVWVSGQPDQPVVNWCSTCVEKYEQAWS